MLPGAQPVLRADRTPVTILRAMVTMPAKSARSEDACVNTWHLNTLGSNMELSMDVFATNLATFYTPIVPLYSSKMNPAGTVIRFYNINNPTAPPQIYTDTLFSTAVSAHATAALPTEVALVLSYAGPKVAGKNQNRRRGHIYLGPWGAIGDNNDNDRPKTQLVGIVKDAAAAFLAESNGGITYNWVVYSQTSVDQGGGGDPYVVVTNGWVDDSWDTQRRRGLDPVVRSTFGVVAGPPGRMARTNGGEESSSEATSSPPPTGSE